MAWNPSPEVAVARDAAKRLHNAPMCIVLWVDSGGLGMASYGKTRELCDKAGELGALVHKSAMRWGEPDEIADLLAEAETEIRNLDSPANIVAVRLREMQRRLG